MVAQRFGQLEADFRRQYAPASQQPQVADPVAQQYAEVAKIINPVVQPQLQAIDLRARASEDYTQFYGRNPEAFEVQDEIEKLFNEAIQNGRPMARQVIADYIIGRDYRTDPVKFRETEKARNERQLERARSAADIGAGATGMHRLEAGLGTLEDFAKLTAEEQAKRLDATGITF
jgi:hypothetical protein